MGLGIKSFPQEKIWLIVILTAGLINGLLHVFLVPPWQHYDEPGHFEYAWLIANKPGLPKSGEYVQSMRREVVASMIEHDFFANLSFRPNLISITEPIWIGISQTDDQPIYYMLVATPLYFVRSSDITFQLYLGRFVSLGLFLLTLWGAYTLISEVTIPKNSLRLLIPLTVALIPGFADIMTAVNNDVGAAALFTLFLWLSVRILHRGITKLNSVLIMILAGICVFTKSTTLMVLPLLIIVLTISFLSQSRKIYGWIFLSLISLILLLITLNFDGVLFWHNTAKDRLVQRESSEVAPDGKYVLELKTPDTNSPLNIIQLIPNSDISNLKGKSVSVGAWIWASSSIQTRAPVLDDGTELKVETIDVDTTPKFFKYTTEVDDHTNQLLIRLQALRQPGNASSSVFYDGIILVEGDHSLDGQPSFLNRKGDQIEWGGERLTNFIRNASFEKYTPQFRAPNNGIFLASLDRLSSITSSLFDIEGYQNYYSSTIQHLFRSFWAVFGWGQVYLIGSKPYRFLLIISLIAVIGDMVYLWRNRKRIPWHTFGFLVIALFGVWGMAATRGVGSIFSSTFIPAARYAYPVIIPTVMLFVVGWREILKVIGEVLHVPSFVQIVTYGLFLVVLNALSIYSIWLYYYAS